MRVFCLLVSGGISLGGGEEGKLDSQWGGEDEAEWSESEKKEKREPKKTIIFPEKYKFSSQKYLKRPNSTNEFYAFTYSDIPTIIW